MLREDQKEFIKHLNSLAHRHSVWDVWSDWLIMASSSIYNAIHRDPKVEDEYLRVAKRYEPKELETMTPTQEEVPPQASAGAGIELPLPTPVFAEQLSLF